MDFNLPYVRQKYLSFFRNDLLPEDFETYEEKISIDFNTKYIQKVVKIGESRSLEMNLYEITHHSENDPRVSLSRESFRLLSRYGVKRALILFVSESRCTNYRLSLVTIELKWEEGTQVKKEYSNPHRYSFYLGPDSKTHTPEYYLIQKSRVKDFDDLKARFSIEVVNKDFYTKIAYLFTELAGGERTVGKKNIREDGCLLLPGTSNDTVKKEFAVRLIGRLIFCWFLTKKKSIKGKPLIPNDLLSTESVKQNLNYYHKILEPLFFATLNTPIDERKPQFRSSPWDQIPFLNGGLFEPGINDYYEIDQIMGISKYINTLKIPDKWIIKLFEVFETYNFTIDENTSVDVELSIEPEMLGRIFENLLAEINPETGQTARKSTGSYYTPRPIVDFMVNESLKQYLLAKTEIEENRITSLLAYEEEGVELEETEQNSIIDAMDGIKVIDPACGSGAFPMGILQKILLILQKIDPESKKWANKKIAGIDNNLLKKEFQKKVEEENWNYLHKLGIIQNSIYGVDIQSIAIDISKLRFFLSLIVDEKIDDTKENRGVEPLPNLEFKFVCANSLIGLPGRETQVELSEENKNIEELKRLREDYFRSYGKEKIIIETKFQDVQNKMFRTSLVWLAAGKNDSKTLKLSQWKPFSGEPNDWFDPYWMFGIKDGFDVVIANPPYIRQESINFKKNLKKEYKIYNSISDLYTYFYEKGFNILKQCGVLTYINSNKFLRARYGIYLRKYLQRNTTIKNIVNFGKRHVFGAITNTLILISIKEKNRENIFSYSDSIEVPNKIKFPQNALVDGEWTIEKPEVINLKSKIEKKGRPLSKWNIRINRGILTGYNEAFIINNKIRNDLQVIDPKVLEIIKPIIRGRDIKKYFYESSDHYLIVTHNGYNTKDGGKIKAININNYPSIKEHLNTYIDFLKKRKDKGNTIYNLRSCAFMDDFKKEKIIWLELTNINKFAYSDKEDYLLAGSFFMIGESLKYLLAFLNSKLCLFYFSLICNSSGMDTIQWKKFALEKLPIIRIDDEKQQPFIEIVDKIINVTNNNDYIHNKGKQIKVTALVEKIDQLLYKLYDLTEDEIEIIENFNR